jgi:putative mRNA 3-end processing factor
VSAAPLIVLRPEGLYCPPGDFWIDPAKRVPKAVITHAHGDHARGGMGHYWGAREGGELMRIRLGPRAPMTLLPYGEAFALGATRVSFHPAGHILGSSQVRIEKDGEVWVATGDFKRCADPSCAPFTPVRCDTLVTEATFAEPFYQWDDPARAVGAMIDWWQAAKAQGQAAVLFCYALGKAQRILAELARHSDETVLLHGAMTPLVKAYRKAGVRMLPTAPVGNPPRGTRFDGRLILAPPGARGTPWMRRFAPYTTGFASGWMQRDDTPRRLAYDQGFVMSDHDDWPGLLRSIEESGAQRVLATHGNSETLVSYLRQRGLAAGPLQSEPLPASA